MYQDKMIINININKNKMLTDKINDLENKIKELDSAKNLKSTVSEHNKIQSEINKYIEIINQFEEKLKQPINESNEIISDDKYYKNLDEIKTLNELFDKTDLDEQIKIYLSVISKMKECDKYLCNQKMEIINLDK